jgi:hypothetical protein
MRSGRPAGSSSQTNDEGSRVSQGHLRSHLGPATSGWTLEVKKEKHASKEALDAAPLAQFLFCPSGRQAGTVRTARLGFQGMTAIATRHAVDPPDEAQAPIGCIQAPDTGTDLLQASRPGQHLSCKWSIMSICGRKQKEERQTRTATDEAMYTEASSRADEDGEQERARRRHQEHGVSRPGWERCQ